MISAVFQIPGNVEDEREALMIDVTKGSIIGRQSLMTQVGTLSITGALLEGIAFIMSSTCLHSTEWNVNCSDVEKILKNAVNAVKKCCYSSRSCSLQPNIIFWNWLIFQQTQENY